jgi:putative radical SAM enzyme (TIGR03279 family)
MSGPSIPLEGIWVEEVRSGSAAARRGIQMGDRLTHLNGEPVADEIDLLFHSEPEGRNRCTFVRDQRSFEVPLPAGDFGINWREFEVRLCRNKCVFCYVHQNPKGMRRSIYVMDEDIRLSFLYGSFTTLSNLRDDERRRVVEQRLSPLYVSVHATDEEARRALLRARKGANPRPILEEIDGFLEAGIEMHTQSVVCPGWNDGTVLERTARDLAARHPGIRTLACVPVGLTGHRRNLPGVSLFDAAGAAAELDRITRLQCEFEERLGTPFVYAADEFYLLAGRELPPLSHYGELEQLDNGVGLVRYWSEIVTEALAELPQLPARPTVLALTGSSARDSVERMFLRGGRSLPFDLRVEAVTNTLFGESVTVSNLLPGRDLLEAVEHARRQGPRPDLVLLPPKVVNADGLFLDDLAFAAAQRRVGVRLLPVPEDPRQIADAIVVAAAAGR